MFILKTDQKVYDKLPAQWELLVYLNCLKELQITLIYHYLKIELLDLQCLKVLFIFFAKKKVKKKNDGCFKDYMLHYLRLLNWYFIKYSEKGLYNQFSVSSKADIQTN